MVEYSTLQLYCTVTGLPPPQIRWLRTGQNGTQQQVNMDSNTDIEDMPQNITGRTTSRLTITSVNSSLHDGLYHCVASNFLGNDSTAQATVTIYGNIYKLILASLTSKRFLHFFFSSSYFNNLQHRQSYQHHS